MRTEEEIRERIKELKLDIDIAKVHKAYSLAVELQREIEALEWVLESEANDDNI